MFAEYLQENFDLNIKILQVICYMQLEQDLNLSPLQFSQLDLQPYMFSAIAVKIMSDPDVMNRARVSANFTLPTFEQAMKTIKSYSFGYSPAPSSKVTCPAPEPELKINADSQPVERIDVVVNNDDNITDDSSSLVSLIRQELFEVEPIVIVKPRQARRKARDTKRAIEHQRKTGLVSVKTVESAKTKYQNADFVAGKMKKKYFHPNGPQLKQFPEVDHNVEHLTRIVKIDKLIYAPPGSGKSTFNKDGKYYDTDYVPCWKGMKADISLTNIHSKIKDCRESLAIIPSRECFMKRCRARGLDVKEQWYDDVLESAKHATHVIYSDEYLSDIFVTSDVARRFTSNV